MTSSLDFISTELVKFIGKNIDLVGREMEDAVHANGYCFRWLLEGADAGPEARADRVNVHVDMIHTILGITVG